MMDLNVTKKKPPTACPRIGWEPDFVGVTTSFGNALEHRFVEEKVGYGPLEPINFKLALA